MALAWARTRFSYSNRFWLQIKNNKEKIRLFLQKAKWDSAPVDGVGFSLGRVLDVGLIQQVLDSQQDLLDGDGRTPILLLVQQRQANSAWTQTIKFSLHN